MYRLQELYLYKQQSSELFSLSDATSTSCSGTTDLIEVASDSNFEPEIASEAVVLVAGGYDQDPAVIGKETGKGNLKFLMNPAHKTDSTSYPPQWGRVLVGSADYTCAVATGTSTSKYTYTPTQTLSTAGYLEHYTGSKTTNGSLKNIFYNIKAGTKISFSANKPVSIEFACEGAWGGQDTTTQPTVTKARVSPSAFKNATVEIMDGNYKVLSCEIDDGQKTAMRDDPSEPNGVGKGDITDRKIKISNLKVYAETTDNIDPMSDLLSASEGAFLLSWGLAMNKISISSSYFQITKCVKAEENGITIFTIDGQLNRNDLTITVNPDGV